MIKTLVYIISAEGFLFQRVFIQNNLETGCFFLKNMVFSDEIIYN